MIDIPDQADYEPKSANIGICESLLVETIVDALRERGIVLARK